MLARLHRAGELTPVWVPNADHEAMRDLIRLRCRPTNRDARASTSSGVSATSRSQARAWDGMANGLPAMAIDFGLRTSRAADCISGLCRCGHGCGAAA